MLLREATGKKGLQIAEAIFLKQTAILHRAAKNRSKFVASCRFFKNRKVSHPQIAVPLIQQTAQSAAGKQVLVIQDTTEINFEHHAGYLSRTDAELGPTGNNKDIGFFLHPSIVIDRESGLLLGASDIYLWNRSYAKQNKQEREYAKQPLEEKESHRWISCAQQSKLVLKDATSILLIADREADIYEEFALLPDKRCHVLIRSKQNRNLYGTQQKLYEYLQLQPEAGRLGIQVRQAANRTGRQATLVVRFAQVQIERPLKRFDNSKLPEYIQLNGVWVEETTQSVPSGEKPVRWILLTTAKVEQLSDALELVRCYGLRWQIELVFASMKSEGVNTEASQLETGSALKSLTVLALLTAIRINQLRLSRNDITNTPATILFSQEQILLLEVLTGRLEGATAKQRNPHRKSTIAWAAWVIARLGGWKGYQSESPPGNKTIYEGWKDFNRLFEGWSLAQISP